MRSYWKIMNLMPLLSTQANGYFYSVSRGRAQKMYELLRSKLLLITTFAYIRTEKSEWRQSKSLHVHVYRYVDAHT